MMNNATSYLVAEVACTGWVGATRHPDGCAAVWQAGDVICRTGRSLETLLADPSGLRWQLQSPFGTLLYLDCVADIAGRVLVVGKTDTPDGRIAYSFDGAAWQFLGPSFADNPFACGRDSSGRLMVAIQVAASLAHVYRLGSDGSWSRSDLPIPVTTQGFLAIYDGVPYLTDQHRIVTVNGEPISMWRMSDDGLAFAGERFDRGRTGIAGAVLGEWNFSAVRGFAYRPRIATVVGADAYVLVAQQAASAAFSFVRPPWPTPRPVPVVAPLRPAWFGYFLSYSTRYQDNSDAPQNVCVINDDELLPDRVLDSWLGPVVVGTTLIDLQAIVDAWSRVVAVFCESDNAVDLMRLGMAARQRMRALGLPRRPVLGIWDVRDDGPEPPLGVAGIDWMGIEAYPILPDRPAEDVVVRTERRIQRSACPVVVIGGTYDRSGAYVGDVGEVVKLQGYWSDVLRRYPHERVRGILLWSDGRPGGTRDYDDLLRPWHEATLNAITGIPAIETVTDPEPDPEPEPEPMPPPTVVNFNPAQQVDIHGRIADAFIHDLKRPQGLATVPDTQEYQDHPEYTIAFPGTDIKIDSRGLAYWTNVAQKLYQDYQGQPGDPYERAAVETRRQIRNSDEGRRANNDPVNPLQ